MTNLTDVLVPTSAEDAAAAFGDGSGLTVVAGGTIVMPDIMLGRVRPERTLYLGRAVDERRDRRRGPNAARPAGALDSVEPGATEVERPLRTQAAELDVRHDDRAARNDSHPGSVTERSGGVICRGGDEDVGEIRQFAPSRGLGSTQAILTL